MGLFLSFFSDCEAELSRSKLWPTANNRKDYNKKHFFPFYTQVCLHIAQGESGVPTHHTERTTNDKTEAPCHHLLLQAQASDLATRRRGSVVTVSQQFISHSMERETTTSGPSGPRELREKVDQAGRDSTSVSWASLVLRRLLRLLGRRDRRSKRHRPPQVRRARRNPAHGDESPLLSLHFSLYTT